METFHCVPQRHINFHQYKGWELVASSTSPAEVKPRKAIGEFEEVFLHVEGVGVPRIHDFQTWSKDVCIEGKGNIRVVLIPGKIPGIDSRDSPQ